MAGELRGKEDAGQSWRRDSARQDAAQHVLGTVAVVLALPVRVMNLAVVVSDECTMRFLHLV